MEVAASGAASPTPVGALSGRPPGAGPQPLGAETEFGSNRRRPRPLQSGRAPSWGPRDPSHPDPALEALKVCEGRRHRHEAHTA